MKFLLLFLLLCASSAIARVGETPEQCASRYGKAVRLEGDLLVTLHEKAGHTIQCTFDEGKCVSVCFIKLELDAARKPIAQSAAEAKVLMEASSGGKAWTISFDDPIKGLTVWKCEGLMAFHAYISSRSVTIMTQDFAEGVRNEKKAGDPAKAKDSLKDF